MFDWLGDFGDWVGNLGSSIGSGLGGLFGDFSLGGSSSNLGSVSNLSDYVPAYTGGDFSSFLSNNANLIGSSGLNPGEWDWMKGGNVGSPLGNISIPGLADIGGGLAQYLMSRNNSKETRDTANRASASADPFASERAFYQEQLKRMYTDPNYLLSIPGYSKGLNTGIEQVKRNSAKAGRLDSGNINYDLLDYGTKYALDQFNNQSNLLTASGANINGGTASANAIMQGNADAQKQSAYGLQALFNPWEKANTDRMAKERIAEKGNYL